MIDTVFLDAGGVLVNPSWGRVAAAMAHHGVAISAAALEAAEPHAKKQLDTGQAIQATNDSTRGWLYFNLVLQHAGVALSPATEAALRELARYHAEHNLWESVPREVPGALERLRAAGHRLVVVSNSNGTMRKHFARLDLAKHFEVLIDSSDVGVEKPDPRIFEIALARIGVKAEEAAYIGDLYSIDVRGARRVGLRPILLDPGRCWGERDCDTASTVLDAVRVLLRRPYAGSLTKG